VVKLQSVFYNFHIFWFYIILIFIFFIYIFYLGSYVTLYDMVDTHLDVLNESYYEALIKRIVGDLQSSGAVVLSITLDNEASPNVGVCAAIAKYFPWILHIRCGCHTIELELQAIYSAFPQLNEIVVSAREIASKCRNTKALQKAFYDAQTALQSSMISLI